MDFDLTKHEVSENDFLHHLAQELMKAPRDNRVILVGLCSKLATYADPYEKAPVFAYFSGDHESNDIVLEWARAISGYKLCLPELKMKYLIAFMEEATLYQMILHGVEDQDLQHCIMKYHNAVETPDQQAIAS